MSDLNAERVRAFELGKLQAQVDEAARLVAIFSHPDAREKPGTAWAILPLGMGLEDMLALLAQLREEPGGTWPGFHRDQLALLHIRHAAAVKLKSNWEMSNEQRH